MKTYVFFLSHLLIFSVFLISCTTENRNETKENLTEEVVLSQEKEIIIEEQILGLWENPNVKNSPRNGGMFDEIQYIATIHFLPKNICMLKIKKFDGDYHTFTKDYNILDKEYLTIGAVGVLKYRMEGNKMTIKSTRNINITLEKK